MPGVPHPVKPWPGHQSNLVWRGREASAALGLRSNMGAIIARLEGGGIPRSPVPDLLEDPQGALEAVLGSSRLRAATRAKRIDATLSALDEFTLRVLTRVYWYPPDQSLAAWDLLANAVEYTEVSGVLHARARSTLSRPNWLRRLSIRHVGEVGASGLRSRSRASQDEIRTIDLIRNDCERLICQCLAQYSRVARSTRLP